MNSDVIWNVNSTNKTVFQWGDWLLKYISFGSHQSPTIEYMKALYDMYKCMLIIFWKKELETLQKKYFEFLLIPSKFFIVIKYLATANQFSTEQ